MKLETCFETRPKLNPFHIDFPFTSIIFRFCTWSEIIDAIHKFDISLENGHGRN